MNFKILLKGYLIRFNILPISAFDNKVPSCSLNSVSSNTIVYIETPSLTDITTSEVRYPYRDGLEFFKDATFTKMLNNCKAIMWFWFESGGQKIYLLLLPQHFDSCKPSGTWGLAVYKDTYNGIGVRFRPYGNGLGITKA